MTMPETGSLAVRTILYGSASCSGTAVTENATFPVAPATANGPLAQQCERRIVLVLDESGSIGSTNGATAAVRAGAKALVDGLIGGGSSLAVIEFNTQARIVPLGGNTFNTVDPTYANGVFATYIDGHGTTPSTRYEPRDYSGNNQYTNWEDALHAAGGLNPELVIFITDGDPTAHNLTATSQETGLVDGSYLAMNPAFGEANAIKGNAIKSRIFAMGVGAAVTSAGSLARLRAISGPDEFTGSNSFANSDYALVENFDDLEEELWALAAQMCSVQVHVSKLVDSLDGKGYVPANGWNFSGNVSVNTATPANYRWLLPGVAEGPPVSNQTRTAATVDLRGQPGRLDFAWLAAPPTATSTIVLSEDTQDPAHDHYHFVSVACMNGQTPIAVPQAPTVTLDGLRVHDDITCTFKNRKDQGQITIAKHFLGTPTRVSLSLDGTVRKTSNDTTLRHRPARREHRPPHGLGAVLQRRDRGALREQLPLRQRGRRDRRERPRHRGRERGGHRRRR